MQKLRLADYDRYCYNKMQFLWGDVHMWHYCVAGIHIAIDVEKAMGAPERIREIVKYTLEHFDQKTKRNSFYSLKGIACRLW